MFATECAGSLSGVQWEEFKKKVKNLNVVHSQRLASNRRSKLEDLENKWREATDKITEKKCKEDIKKLLLYNVESIRIRAKADELENRDLPTKYLLRRERERAEGKNIDEIDDNGVLIADHRGIMRTVCNFYRDLYTSQCINDADIETELNDLPQLNEYDKLTCEGPLTYDECWQAVRKMRNERSPGPDGLPAEFYKLFFPIFGQYFVDMINSVYEQLDELPASMRTSYITLLCKKPEQRQFLSNWRPISLLNVDYKIISRVLVGRIRKILEHIVNKNQTSAVPGRSVINNMTTIRDVMAFYRETNRGLYVLTVDQAKAFDRVEHNFLHAVLDKFGFGTQFKAWIKILYKNVNSRVCVNRFLTDQFDVRRSVRQGCSLSPALYVLCIEILALKLKNDVIYKGIRLPDGVTDIKIIVHADDTALFAESATSLRRFFEVYSRFSAISGAAINKEKCVVYKQGYPDNGECAQLGVKQADSIKICGVWFGTSAQEKNEDHILTSVREKVKCYEQRKLNIYTRVTIINSVFLANLWYIASVYDFRKSFYKELDKIIYKFLWRTTEWLARNVLVNSRSSGGLGIVHAQAKVKAIRLMQAISVLKDPDKASSVLARRWIGVRLRKFFFVKPSRTVVFTLSADGVYKNVLKDIKVIMELGSKWLEEATTAKVYVEILKGFKKRPKIEEKNKQIQYCFVWSEFDLYPIDLDAKEIWYRIIHQVITVRDIMFRYKIINTWVCSLCGRKAETIEHLFLLCDKVQQLKRSLLSWFLDKRDLNINDILYPHFYGERGGMRNAILVSEYLFFIWVKRRQLVFDKKSFSEEELKAGWEGRIKWRIKADNKRWDKDKFIEIWGESKEAIICRL
jgi:hypothetical protein